MKTLKNLKKGDKVAILSTARKVLLDEIKFAINIFESWGLVVELAENLFQEDKGVVAEGFLKDKNYFKATKILAKHDENYMPPEIGEKKGD